MKALFDAISASKYLMRLGVIVAQLKSAIARGQLPQTVQLLESRAPEAGETAEHLARLAAVFVCEAPPDLSSALADALDEAVKMLRLPCNQKLLRDDPKAFLSVEQAAQALRQALRDQAEMHNG